MIRTKDVIWFIIIIVMIISMIVGIIEASSRAHPYSFEEDKTTNCRYNSYATKYNPFYRLSCELFEKRN